MEFWSKVVHTRRRVFDIFMKIDVIKTSAYRMN